MNSVSCWLKGIDILLHISKEHARRTSIIIQTKFIYIYSLFFWLSIAILTLNVIIIIIISEGFIHHASLWWSQKHGKMVSTWTLFQRLVLIRTEQMDAGRLWTDVSYSKQQARNMVMPVDDVTCNETLSLAEMKSTEPRFRVMSERAAADVAAASPSITNRMPADSSALTVYCRTEAGIWRTTPGKLLLVLELHNSG